MAGPLKGAVKLVTTLADTLLPPLTAAPAKVEPYTARAMGTAVQERTRKHPVVVLPPASVARRGHRLPRGGHRLLGTKAGESEVSETNTLQPILLQADKAVRVQKGNGNILVTGATGIITQRHAREAHKERGSALVVNVTSTTDQEQEAEKGRENVPTILVGTMTVGDQCMKLKKVMNKGTKAILQKERNVPATDAGMSTPGLVTVVTVVVTTDDGPGQGHHLAVTSSIVGVRRICARETGVSHPKQLRRGGERDTVDVDRIRRCCRSTAS